MESSNTIRFVLPIIILVLTQFNCLFSATYAERPLKTGDVFTPGGMLPVAVKLIEKVDEPGSGKGVVSSAKNAEDLADKLFESFFMTSKRFVILTEFDIKGLDALQALALSGEIANSRQEDSVTEDPVAQNAEMVLRGQIITVNKKGNRSKYRLLTKKINDKKNIERRGIELAKKLSKKRRLVVKSRRDFREKHAGNLKEPPCRWRYECSDPGDLDSCQLHTDCNTDETQTTTGYIGVQKKIDMKERIILDNFRKMVGLSVVDEEVEKILETRVLYLKPNNLDENDRIESLSEYFNKIIMAQGAVESTTAIFNNHIDAQTESSNEAKQGSNETAQGSNETAQGSNEAAQGSNEAKQGSNEPAQGNNEAAQGSNEAKQGSNEAKQVNNKATKGSNGAKQGSNEAAQRSNEAEQESNEATQGINEPRESIISNENSQKEDNDNIQNSTDIKTMFQRKRKF